MFAHFGWSTRGAFQDAGEKACSLVSWRTRRCNWNHKMRNQALSYQNSALAGIQVGSKQELSMEVKTGTCLM